MRLLDGLRHLPCGAIKRRGRLAQLVERFLYTEDVGGSSPSSPTTVPAAGLGTILSCWERRRIAFPNWSVITMRSYDRAVLACFDP